MTKNTETNVEDARLAFTNVQGRIDEVDELRAMTTNLPKALVTALRIGREVREPEVWQQFARLPTDMFDIRHVDEVLLFARAAWYARHMALNAAVEVSRAKLDEDLVEEGTELKERMFKVLEFCLGHERDMRDALASIRVGTGYIDLAEDLGRLAELYRANRSEVSKVGLFYQAGDADRAQAMSDRIMDELGENGETEAEMWQRRVLASWTLLLTAYDEVAAAGRFLFRHDRPSERFPSLISAGRKPARRSRSSGSEPDAEPQSDESGDSSVPDGDADI